MAFRRTFEGDGTIFFRGTEIPTNYRIVATRTPDIVSASGTAEVSPQHFITLLEASEAIQLKLSSGDIVDIIFLGGNLDSPAKINVNSRMPGF